MNVFTIHGLDLQQNWKRLTEIPYFYLYIVLFAAHSTTMAVVPTQTSQLAESTPRTRKYSSPFPKPAGGRPQGKEKEVNRPKLKLENSYLRVLVMSDVVFFQWLKVNHLIHNFCCSKLWNVPPLFNLINFICLLYWSFTWGYTRIWYNMKNVWQRNEYIMRKAR